MVTIILNIVILALTIVCIVIAYITLFTFAGVDKPFNVERKHQINYIVVTEEYDRGFSEEYDALEFAALHAGTVIKVESGETIADFTTIDLPFDAFKERNNNQ